MYKHPSEKGQALIVVALAAIGLFGFSALAIDGSMVYSDKRHAQNSADTAAFAGALAHARGQNISTAALDRAASNGYNNDTTNNVVSVTLVDSALGDCPLNRSGKEITVTITSHVKATFARVIGRDQMTNRVSATTRACGSYTGPPFDGNAIVSLAPSGVGFDANGTADWIINGGGIYVNSSGNPAATCGGSAGVTAPSVTSVGTTSFGCHTVNIGSTTTGAPQISPSTYASLFPRQPACNGTATRVSGVWQPQAGADGSRVAFDDDKVFAPGLYCVTNNPGTTHDTIVGTGVTFYMTDPSFSIKFNGGGSLTATAPVSGEYKGILMYLKPSFDVNGNLLNTQAIDMRGNGLGAMVGTIFAPSADVTMFGNSGTAAIDSQVIAYQVDAGGNADIVVAYQPLNNYQVSQPLTLSLLK